MRALANSGHVGGFRAPGAQQAVECSGTPPRLAKDGSRRPAASFVLSCLLAVGVAGCATPPPFSRPASEPAFSGLMAQPPVVTRTALTGTRDKVLAVVLTRNVAHSRTLNDTMRRQYTAWSVEFKLPHLAADIDGVLSDERLMSVLFAPMRSAFKEVRLVRDIPEGFESGADYVGVLDLDLNHEELATFPTQRQMHTAKVSLLVIDPQLVAGPAVTAQVVHEQATGVKGVDGNIRDSLYAIKTSRTQMLEQFKADFDSRIKR